MGLIPTIQACEQLGIKPGTLHQRAHRAGIKPHKLGSMVWWSEEQLRQLGGPVQKRTIKCKDALTDTPKEGSI